MRIVSVRNNSSDCSNTFRHKFCYPSILNPSRCLYNQLWYYWICLHSVWWLHIAWRAYLWCSPPSNFWTCLPPILIYLIIRDFGEFGHFQEWIYKRNTQICRIFILTLAISMSTNLTRKIRHNSIIWSLPIKDDFRRNTTLGSNVYFHSQTI